MMYEYAVILMRPQTKYVGVGIDIHTEVKINHIREKLDDYTSQGFEPFIGCGEVLILRKQTETPCSEGRRFEWEAKLNNGG